MPLLVPSAPQPNVCVRTNVTSSAIVCLPYAHMKCHTFSESMRIHSFAFHQANLDPFHSISWGHPKMTESVRMICDRGAVHRMCTKYEYCIYNWVSASFRALWHREYQAWRNKFDALRTAYETLWFLCCSHFIYCCGIEYLRCFSFLQRKIVLCGHEKLIALQFTLVRCNSSDDSTAK